ncbi:MAG: adenylyltransferase/cytidyltransferase family protein [Chlamydiota bacterium]
MKSKTEKKILELSQLEKVLPSLRKEKKTIVTLNGSFDLLHAGHLYIIEEAAKLGDVLIVALNSDESIRQYKNPSRPIISLPYRLQMMAALECVDFVTFFHEVDPRNLLSRICPDIHVNGAEYGSECIEKEIVEKGGGRLHLVKRIDGLSTSAIIEKIVKCVSLEP